MNTKGILKEYKKKQKIYRNKKKDVIDVILIRYENPWNLFINSQDYYWKEYVFKSMKKTKI